MANCFYASHVVSELSIDEDNNGLFVAIPSENVENTSYIVRCTESKTGVTVNTCSCKGFYYRHHCKHVEIVQSYWNHIYKPVAKVAAPKARKPRNGLVRKVRNGGLVKVEQKVAPVAKIIEQAVEAKEAARTPVKAVAVKVAKSDESSSKQPIKSVDVAQKVESFKQSWGKPNRQREDWTIAAPLTSNQGFSILKR